MDEILKKEFELKYGLRKGDRILKKGTVRESTGKDEYKATLAAKKVPEKRLFLLLAECTELEGEKITFDDLMQMKSVDLAIIAQVYNELNGGEESEGEGEEDFIE